MRSLSGTVARVSVRKHGGWGIASIRVANSKNRITIVGRGVGDLTEGDNIVAHGDDKHHERYGNQFEVVDIELVEQLGHPGVEHAIISFQGIGKVHAARLADIYANDDPQDPKEFMRYLMNHLRVSDVLANWLAPELPKLLAVTPKLGPRGLSAFVSWLKSNYAQYESRVDPETGKKMKSTTVRGFRAKIETALDRCLTVFSTDPYSVMRHQYSFREADTILVKRGFIDKHDQVRMRYALDDLLTEKPDTIMPYHAAVHQANAEYGIELETDLFADDEAEPAELPNNILRVELAGGDYLAEAKLLKAEHAILRGLSSLMRSPVVEMPKLTAEEMHHGLVTGITLTQEQIDTVTRSVCAPVSIITGGPGVGKTSSVRALINVLNHAVKTDILLAAPTNKAARRLHQQTGLSTSSVHRLLGAFPDHSYEGDEFGNGFVFDKNAANPFRNTTLVLDESSMIDTRLFAAIVSALGSGCRLIMIGDHQQLPPIREGYPLRDLLDRVPTSHLTKILRSNPGQMQLNHAAIRAGRLSHVRHEAAADWQFIECANDDEIMTALLRVAAPLSAQTGPYGFQIITPRRTGHALSTYEINKKFREQHLRTTDYRFVVGDKGLCLATFPSANMVNGDMFMVTGVDEKTGTMEIVKELRQPGEDDKYLVPRQAKGLDFAWAITVHKYQGCETDTVVFLCSPSFGQFMNRNMVYTAITRARKKVIIIGDKQAFLDATRLEETERLTALNLLTRPGLDHGIANRHLIDPVAVAAASRAADDDDSVDEAEEANDGEDFFDTFAT